MLPAHFLGRGGWSAFGCRRFDPVQNSPRERERGMANGDRGAPGTGRLVGMNGLRGVAALSILTTHVWDYGTPAPLHGAIGGGPVDVGLLHPVFAVLGLSVALFFTLSGFLL